MDASLAAGEPEPAFSTLLQLSLDIGSFASDWSHCDRIATYVSRMVSHDRMDALQYANLFSSAFNELLETAFRCHGDEGRVSFTISRGGPIDRIELSIPCDAQAHAFYAGAVAALAADDYRQRYVNALLEEDDLDPGVGLLELAVDYAARIEIRPEPAAVRLVTDLELDAPMPGAVVKP